MVYNLVFAPIIFLQSLQYVKSWSSPFDSFAGKSLRTPTLLLMDQTEPEDCIYFDRRCFLSKMKSLAGVGVGGMYLGSTAAVASDAVLPDPGEIAQAIPSSWDNEIPFDAVKDFARLDGSDDSKFYTETRFVEHVDDQAVQLMTDFISRSVKPGDAVLDLGSSWTSHITNPSKLSRITGLGMNSEELKANSALTEYTVLNLNETPPPNLPYEDQSFDVVLCQLSIDYFIHPLELMKEASRVMKPGAKIYIIFSNRLFLSKAVGIWTGADDIDHAYTVGAYLHYSDEKFDSIKADDLSVRKRGKIIGDPLYVVSARKAS